MFGYLVKELREKCNVSQVELSRRIGISQTAISQMENGDKRMKESTVKKICSYFKITYGDLIIMNFERNYIPETEFQIAMKDCLVNLLSKLKTKGI